MTNARTMGRTSKQVSSIAKPSSSSRLPLIAATAILLISGLALSHLMFWEEISSQMETEDWTEAQGVILSSGIESEVSCGGEEGCSTTYQPFAEYRYEVEGNSYEGSRIAFTWDSSFVAIYLILSIFSNYLPDFKLEKYINLMVDSINDETSYQILSCNRF